MATDTTPPVMDPHAGPSPEREGVGSTLATAFARGGNNFDLMRLAAALLVLASHTYILTGHGDAEPIGIVTRHLVDGGSFAVGVFFILSGFLIARSAQRHGPAAYLRARILRLYPAFLAAIVVQTLLLGPALTTLPLGDYFAGLSGVPRALLFSAPPSLPGVFDANAVPGIVNGSLWTLRVEALCYLGLLAMAVAGLLRRGRILVPLAIAWAAQAAIIAGRTHLLPAAVASLHVVAIADCALDFLMGATLWLYAPTIRRNAWLMVAAAAAIPLAATTLAGAAVLHLALPYLVVAIGLTRPVFKRFPDISYGTYLYAFPVQQTLVALTGPIDPMALTALAIPPTLLLAAASRFFIERPALRLRRAPASHRPPCASRRE